MMMDEETHARVCDLFSALSNPTRLRITEILIDQTMSVGDVASTLNISLSGASQHLSQLARAGVLTSEMSGTTKTYRVRGPRIGRILGLIEEFCQVHSLAGSASGKATVK
ncbi:hypothetical protein BH11ARM1_BH11ARM1_07200 [soil metagenome]